MHKLRLISSALAAFMVASMLSGCTGGTAEPTSMPMSSDSQTLTPDPAAEATAVTESADAGMEAKAAEKAAAEEAEAAAEAAKEDEAAAKQEAAIVAAAYRQLSDLVMTSLTNDNQPRKY